MFQRYVSIDWSGAGTDEKRVNVCVVEAFKQQSRIVSPPNVQAGVKRWSRKEVVCYLNDILQPKAPRAMVAMDFGFGLPWGADHAIFKCHGWRAMLDVLAKLYNYHGTARATAEAINSDNRFNGHGPYRFNNNRTDYRFYLDHGGGYYRIAEMAVPQAISQWYLGSGGTVGFHTITGLASLAVLLSRRDAGELYFDVWPQEVLEPRADRHVLVESYPAISPKLDDKHYDPCADDHQRDAWRVLAWLLRADKTGTISTAFTIPETRFGRIQSVSFLDQVQFEGWIIGIS